MNIVKLTDLVSRGSKIRKTVDPKVVLQKGDYLEGTILDANSIIALIDASGKVPSENLPTIPSQTAVKGNAESEYRTGNVNITPANIGLGNVGNFKAVSTEASQGLTDTEKANARTNIGAGTSSFSGSYNDLSNKPILIQQLIISSNTSSTCSITGSSNSGKEETIIYANSGSSDVTVTVPTTYKTPDGAAIELTCKAGGYCEVSYLNIGGTIYARGL